MNMVRAISALMIVSLIMAFAITSAAAAEGLLRSPGDKEGTIDVSVEKMENERSLISIAALSGMVIILIVVIYSLIKYIRSDQKKSKALKEKVQCMGDDEAEYFLENMDDRTPAASANNDIDKFLKDDERAVVNILRQREGICSQPTLRVVGNFSKATLSRLLSELEERNIIKKEKRGKKNLVILR